MPTVGFLHTEPNQVAVFARLVRDRAPWLVDVHVVDASLLADLRLRGLDDHIRHRLGARLGELVGRAVDAVVCTCSVLGEEAWRLAPSGGVPVYGPGQVIAANGLFSLR